MALPFNDVFKRKVFLHEGRLSSTHRYAMEYISKSRPSQLICITSDEQTDGIGQHGRKWHSQPHSNLNMSVILSPENMSTDYLFFINILSATALHIALSAFSAEPLKIKWPNDIYHKDNKLAGILINSTLKGSDIQHLILSFGVNITTKIENSDFNFTNLDSIKSKDISAKILRNKIIMELEKSFILLRDDKKDEILSHYHSVLYKKDVLHTFSTEESGKFDGKIRKVNENGEIKIERNGKIESYKNGEIKYL